MFLNRKKNIKIRKKNFMKSENYRKFTFVCLNTVWAEGDGRLCGRVAQLRHLS